MQTVAGPMVMLNTIMAEALDHCATALETAVADGTDFNEAVQALLADIIADHGKVIFNGNGYSEEWPVEAEQRGLKNLRTTVDALPELITPEAIELFRSTSVFNEREMHSRYEIGLEQYLLTITVEANLTGEMGHTIILPAAMRYQTELAQNVAALKAAGVEADTATCSRRSRRRSPTCGPASSALTAAVEDEHDDDALAHATYVRDTVLPGDGRGARGRRRPGEHGGRRPVVAADVPGDALHPLTARAPGGLSRWEPARRAPAARPTRPRRSRPPPASSSPSGCRRRRRPRAAWSPGWRAAGRRPSARGARRAR